MKTRILLLWLVAVAASLCAFAQYAQFRPLSQEPGTCTYGDAYQNVATGKVRFCSAANTWTDLNGGGVTTVSIVTANGFSGTVTNPTTAPALTLQTDGMRVATVTLTNAQIKALPTTPIEIVAAQGSGKIIVLHQAILAFTWTANYTNIDAASSLYCAYTGWGGQALNYLDEGAPQTGTVSYFLASGFSKVVRLSSYNPTRTTPVAETTGYVDGYSPNQAVEVGMANDPSGNLTGGNAANTIKVTVYYSVISVP